MNKAAAIYARVSTDEQVKGFSLGSQVEQLQIYLERKGYTDIEVFVDDGYSGKDFNRPNIQRLFRNLDRFETIAVWKVDRLSRNNEQILSLINNYLKPYGKRLLVSTCDIDSSTANGYMFISLLGTFAEYEKTQIIERVESGMVKRAKSGKWNGGALLGYDIVDGKLIINEHESAIVKEIFELRVTGKGYKSIVNHINTKGYRTKKGNPFGINSIKTILENPTYAGLIRWGKHRQWSSKRRSGKQSNVPLVEGDHTAIIDRDLWKTAQSITESRKNNKMTSNFEGEFILAGILKCPKCGKGMVMHKTKMRNNKGYYLYYQCQNFHQKGLAACNSNLVGKVEIEKKVLEKIKDLISCPNIIEGVCENLEREKDENIQGFKEELNILKLEYDEKVKEEGTISARVRNAIKDKDEEALISYNSILSHVVKEREEIEKRINEYEIYIKNHSTVLNINKDLVLEALRSFDELFEIADNKTRKVLMRSIIKKIELEEDRKTIKSITLWFDEEDNTPPPPPSIFFGEGFPVNEVRRTIP